MDCGFGALCRDGTSHRMCHCVAVRSAALIFAVLCRLHVSLSMDRKIQRLMGRLSPDDGFPPDSAGDHLFETDEFLPF